ncbi:uncharacterized protein LOC122513898 [Polistes fuscatus]|uniref:uncharacterized protein LOC122513898 n=1 Tax=Polistes fuscatus TaxID=30207 RepID=UPI001CA904C0|nr:uncharacterized protein LOC122513898 [Polistes fuscatus]
MRKEFLKEILEARLSPNTSPQNFLFYVLLDSIDDYQEQSDLSDPDTKNVPPTVSKASDESVETQGSEDPILSNSILKMLGKEKRLSKDKTYKIHSELAACWNNIVSSGLEKDVKTSLIEKYPNKGNCSLSPPILNPELTPLLHKTAKTRDKYLSSNQDLCGRSLVGLGQAISMIINDDIDPIDKNDLLQILCDSSSLLCESFYQIGKSRRSQIYPCVDGKRKPVLEDSITDDFLFGKDLEKFSCVKKSFKLERPVCDTREPQSGGLPPFPTCGTSFQQDEPSFDPLTSSVSDSVSFSSTESAIDHEVESFIPMNDNFSDDDNIKMQKAIDDLLSIGAVQECVEEDGQFLSKTIHFKMEDFRTVLKLISKGCFMASFDLQDAYLMIPIHKDFWKFLRFYWQGHLYEFICLPFGLSTAPWVFTKIMKPVISHLRLLGWLSVVYLDDWWLVGTSRYLCSQNIKVSREFLEYLGFILNLKKSNLDPSTSCKFLGFIFNSQEFSQLVGNITAACPAINYGWLHSKKFERQRYLELLKANDNYDCVMKISSSLTPEFNWWLNNIFISNNPIRSSKFSTTIFSDASSTGWGATCDGQVVFGHWNNDEKSFHINYLELLAVFNGLKTFASNLFDCEILLRVDNSTAIAYINKMGGTKYEYLNDLTYEIWEWCEQRNLWLFASYIPSKDNEADEASRIDNIDTEWELSPFAFQNIVYKFNQPEIDLFASNSNNKCEKYCSWHRDSLASCIDAFTVDWNEYYFYAFPPFSLILKTLKKIQTYQTCGILVVPNWCGQPWKIQHPLAQKMSLMAARLSASSTLRQYSKPIKDWVSYCSSKDINAFHPQENDVICFLTHKFNEGANYSTLNTARSALSLVCDINIGKNPLVSRLLKGTYNFKPAKPRYDRIYSLDPILKELEALSPLNELDLPQLTTKLAVLIALVTAHRQGALQPLLLLPKYHNNLNLCVVSTLDFYLEKTSLLVQNPDNLFLTTVKPYKNASKDTVSSWIRAFLQSCIDKVYFNFNHIVDNVHCCSEHLQSDPENEA